MSDDASKCYHLIDQKITTSERVNERSEHPIDGCMSFHMIAVSKSGVFTTKTVHHVDDEVINLTGEEEPLESHKSLVDETSNALEFEFSPLLLMFEVIQHDIHWS